VRWREKQGIREIGVLREKGRKIVKGEKIFKK